ncbi:hypothetical protein DITRI_Ditri20bG0004400 [Diplodiscus trichospermus]
MLHHSSLASADMLHLQPWLTQGSRDDYCVLLYYKYASIPLFSFYHSNCSSLGLLGRVLLSPNGVNVTHPLSDKVALECGFTSLSIRVVKELVTFSSHPLLKAPEVSNAGRHLSAAEFHSVLQSAGQLMKSEYSNNDKQLVLLDARNLYETRIGKFHAQVWKHWIQVSGTGSIVIFPGG